MQWTLSAVTADITEEQVKHFCIYKYLEEKNLEDSIIYSLFDII